MSRERPLRVFLGHHRCASTWVNDIFRAASRELNLRHATVHSPRNFDHDLQGFVDRTGVDCLAYINAEHRYVRQLRRFKGFHVVRDPRDVSVSAYFSHLYSHGITEDWADLGERRRQLQGLSKDEGLLAEIGALRWEIDCMVDWDYADPSIMEWKLETLTADPYRHFLEIFRFLGLLEEARLTLARRALYLANRGLRVLESAAGGRVGVPLAPGRLPAERVLGIVWENEFAKKAMGRSPGEEDPRSHYRKGVAGDWKNHFTPEHAAYFREHYGDALTKLGYE